MKYFIAGIAILCLVFAFCAANEYYEDQLLSEIQFLLEDTQRCLISEEQDAAIARISAANDLWEKSNNYFAVVLVCDRVDELSHVLSLALDSLYRGSDSAADSVTQALSLVKSIVADEQLSLRNILAISYRR